MISIRFRSLAICTVTALGSAVLFAQTPGAANGSGAGSGSTTGTGSNAGAASSNGSATSADTASTGAGSASGGTKSADKMFLKKASLGGLAEVQMGQLAAQKASSDDVKKFGQKMVDDHTALNEQMKPFAAAAGLTPPTKLSPKDQAEYDKLNGLSGADFDKEYIAYMKKDHHMDLKEFRKEEATTKDASLKDAVTKGEAVVQEHSTMVDKMAKGSTSTASM